eukprot:SAG11_NODE_36059_length_263_cov_1.256098_1_plen_58_part_10
MALFLTNVNSLVGNMSGWVDLGKPQFRDAANKDKYCTAATLMIYKERTDHLPREPRQL